MDVNAFLDSLRGSSRTPADVAAEVKAFSAEEQTAIRDEALRRLETGELSVGTATVVLGAADAEPIVPALVRLLHSDAATLEVRVAALTLLRRTGCDVRAELKSLDPEVAFEIVSEAVLQLDRGGTLLDALDEGNPGGGEREPV